MCHNTYQLSAIVQEGNTGPSIVPDTVYSLSCESAYSNLFCLQANASDWKRGSCNVTRKAFECPLYGKYRSYSQFFLWQITTFVIKIAYQLQGKEFITESKAVTPYFKCSDVSSIGPHHAMFIVQNQTHSKGDCKK